MPFHLVRWQARAQHMRPKNHGGKQTQLRRKQNQDPFLIEHIRLRTGMYIGRIGDEAIMMTAPTFSSRRSSTMPLMNTSWDSARRPYRHRRQSSPCPGFRKGIPSKIVDCVTINTGAKYNDEVFQFSVGLNGVGTKAVNALSQSFTVKSHRDGPMHRFIFKRLLAGEKKVNAEPMALSSALNPTEAFSKNCSYARS